MAAMREPPAGARARGRRRGVRLPRRPRAPGPALDAVDRARVGVPAPPGAGPPLAALPALQPALRGRVPAPVAARTAQHRADELRRRDHRMRPRRAAARAGLRRPRPAHARRRERPRAPGRGARRGRMPFEEAGRGRGHAARRHRLVGSRGRRRRRPTRSSSRSARRRSRTSRSTCATSASVLDDLLPVLRPGHLLVLRSTIAPRTTEFVAGYIEKHLDLEVGRDVFVAHVPERIAAGRFFEEIELAAVHRRRRRRGLGRGRRRAVRAARRADRADEPGRGRAGEDLDATSCATRCSRSPTG